MNTAPTVIVSRIGNRVMECPADLLAVLERERLVHWVEVENGISASLSDDLLSEAEAIKNSSAQHIRQSGKAT